MSKRIHSKKAWNDILVKEMEARVQGSIESAQTNQKVLASSNAYRAKLLIATKFGKIVRHKLRSKTFSCRRTVHNMRNWVLGRRNGALRLFVSFVRNQLFTTVCFAGHAIALHIERVSDG